MTPTKGKQPNLSKESAGLPSLEWKRSQSSFSDSSFAFAFSHFRFAEHSLKPARVAKCVRVQIRSTRENSPQDQSVRPVDFWSCSSVAAYNHRCLGDAHFGFPVKKFFWLSENKIDFFLVDFSGGF
jgi:hypothetical protein